MRIVLLNSFLIVFLLSIHSSSALWLIEIGKAHIFFMWNITSLKFSGILLILYCCPAIVVMYFSFTLNFLGLHHFLLLIMWAVSLSAISNALVYSDQFGYLKEAFAINRLLPSLNSIGDLPLLSLTLRPNSLNKVWFFLAPTPAPALCFPVTYG